MVDMNKRHEGRWLSRNFDEISMEKIHMMERVFSGLVARAVDPWGFNALWCSLAATPGSWGNHLFNMSVHPELENMLVGFGCDSDRRNAWGVSFRMAMDAIQSLDAVRGDVVFPWQ